MPEESTNSGEDSILYEVVERHIARITLNRPHRRNAIAVPAMNDDLTEAIRTAEDDDDIKVIILSGAGPDFCSGEDVREVPVEAVIVEHNSAGLANSSPKSEVLPGHFREA